MYIFSMIFCHFHNMKDISERIWTKRKNPDLWKQNVRKCKRNSGQKYINSKNIEI